MATTLPAIRSSVAAQSAADASSPAPTTTGAGSFGVAAAGGGTGSGGTTVALAPGAVAVAAAVCAAGVGTGVGAGGAADHAAAEAINAAQVAQAQSLNVIVNIQIPPESGREIHPHYSDAAACRAARS